MKLLKIMMLGLTTLLFLGCDVKTGRDAEDFGSYYYTHGYDDDELGRQTLIGSLEVVDRQTETPLSGIRIEGWITQNRVVLDSFVVRTNELGLARIDVSTFNRDRPYSWLEVRILEPGYRPFIKTISIDKIDTLVESRGTLTTVYGVNDIFYLSRL